MKQNNINPEKIEIALQEMAEGQHVEKDPVRGDVIHPKADKVRQFADVYFAEIERFRLNESNRKIIDDFLLKIQPK